MVDTFHNRRFNNQEIFQTNLELALTGSMNVIAAEFALSRQFLLDLLVVNRSSRGAATCMTINQVKNLSRTVLKILEV